VNGIVATLRRELSAYFSSPLAYVLLTFFLLINGYYFSVIVGYLNNPRSAGFGAPLELFFGQTIFTWLVLLFAGTFLTMRLVSEELRSGTIEVLMTAPVTEAQVVIGKYLAAVAFYVFLWAPTLIYVGLMARHLDVAWGPVASGYLGIFGVGALFLSVGIFASATSKNQIVAAIVTFACLFVLFSVGLLDGLFGDPEIKKVFAYMDLWSHMAEFAKGVVDTRRLVYYASTIAFFLFLTTKALEAKKWR
jgi:ABC-2 type transport system permease protein